MKKRLIKSLVLLISLLIFTFFGIENGEAQKKINLIGRETIHFTLPSTEDRTIHYSEDYYGKYNLIITFFPAAFTPL